MIRLVAHQLPPSPVSRLSLFISVAGRAYSGGGGGGGRGAKSYNREKAWLSINSLMLCGVGYIVRIEEARKTEKNPKLLFLTIKL
jgi:hypothetical protein